MDMNLANIFILGAAFGAVSSAVAGTLAVTFGMSSVPGVVLIAFVSVVTGVSSLIGGALQ